MLRRFPTIPVYTYTHYVLSKNIFVFGFTAEIPPTTTTTEQPSDIISVHVVVIILLALAIAVMMTLMIVFAVLYLKGKKTRIGSSSERLMEEPEKPNCKHDSNDFISSLNTLDNRTLESHHLDMVQKEYLQ